MTSIRIKLASLQQFASSKTCSNCGTKKTSLSLSERTFSCECGFVCDRDVNAAINLVRLVKSDFKPVDKKELSPLVEAGSKQLPMQLDLFFA